MHQVEETRCRIELFLVAPGNDGEIFFTRRHCKAGGDPDAAARKLLEPVAALWLHSTSWRYESDGLVLTYLAFCEKSNQRDVFKERIEIGPKRQVHQSRPFQPRPDCITTSDVLTHGLRHLGWLVCRATENPWLKNLDDSTLAWLRSLDPLPAGRI